MATNIINAASGGVTAKWLIGTTSFTLTGQTAANAGLSSAGQGRFYFDSTANKFKVSENGGAYVDLVPGSSLPSGTTGQTLRHNGTAWVASSDLTNDGTNVIISGSGFQLYKYAATPNLALFHSNGSVGAPTTTLSGDQMGVVSMRGYGATGYSGVGNARIAAFAEETFTNSAFGSRLSFWTTPIGSTSNTEKMRITGGGNVLIGTTDDDGTPATGRLVVKGSTANGTSHIFVGRDSDEVNVFTLNTDGNLNASGTGVFGGAAGGAGRPRPRRCAVSRRCSPAPGKRRRVCRGVAPCSPSPRAVRAARNPPAARPGAACRPRPRATRGPRPAGTVEPG